MPSETILRYDLAGEPGDSLGDRMKSYERRETGRHVLSLLPICARMDGRGFSAFTRGMTRPFDPLLSRLMIRTTEALVGETHAKIGYTQSDEISLVWQAERFESAIFFNGRVSKMTSILAALTTAIFTEGLYGIAEFESYRARRPHFDCRVFEVPDRTEASNLLLWREQDAARNAVSMVAQAHFSHRDLHGKSGPVMKKMLLNAGIDFDTFPAFFRRGSFVRRQTIGREYTADELACIPPVNRPLPGTRVMRSVVGAIAMPPFGTVQNRDAVVFDGAEPVVMPENDE